MAYLSDIPSDYALHIVKLRMNVDQLVRYLYENPTPSTVEHFKFVNQHLLKDIALPGQIVLISPVGATSCTSQEIAFREVAERVDKRLAATSDAERKLLANNYQFLSNVASYNGVVLGSSVAAWQGHVRQVKEILKDIEKSYVASYGRTGNLSNQAFFSSRRMQFQKLDRVLRRFLQPRLGGSILPGDMRRNLGLSTKSIVHQWNRMGTPATKIFGFEENFVQTTKMATNLKRLGYVGIALTGVEAHANIQKACTLKPNSKQCGRTRYTETGKAAGSVVGGAAGGFLGGWVTCNLIFGLPSSGTSMFWCGIVAGGIGGYTGGKVGSSIGEGSGSFLYDTRLQP